MIKRMKNTAIITILCMLFGCTSHKKSLHITVIDGKPKRIIKEKQHYNTYNENIERLIPSIEIISKNKNNLKLSIQGNISSSGLSINKVKRIYFKESKLEQETITLKYIVEIQRIAGKENVSIRGYNYEQQMIYKIPKGTKHIKLELYEDYVGNRFKENSKLVFEDVKFIVLDYFH